MFFPSLDNLVKNLSGLPGIGQRSALRIAFHILRMDDEQANQLARSLQTVRREIHFCKVCAGLTDQTVCEYCQDDSRSSDLLCIVEEPGDIFAIEKTGEFKGKYHVLGGALSPLDGIGPGELRIRELEERCGKDQVSELFVATNPTLEGDATAQYLADLFSQKPEIKLTRISHGIPTGTQIEFADRAALARSIRGRQSL